MTIIYESYGKRFKQGVIFSEKYRLNSQNDDNKYIHLSFSYSQRQLKFVKISVIRGRKNLLKNIHYHE